MHINLLFLSLFCVKSLFGVMIHFNLHCLFFCARWTLNWVNRVPSFFTPTVLFLLPFLFFSFSFSEILWIYEGVLISQPDQEGLRYVLMFGHLVRFYDVGQAENFFSTPIATPKPVPLFSLFLLIHIISLPFEIFSLQTNTFFFLLFFSFYLPALFLFSPSFFPFISTFSNFLAFTFFLIPSSFFLFISSQWPLSSPVFLLPFLIHHPANNVPFSFSTYSLNRSRKQAMTLGRLNGVVWCSLSSGKAIDKYLKRWMTLNRAETDNR